MTMTNLAATTAAGELAETRPTSWLLVPDRGERKQPVVSKANELN